MKRILSYHPTINVVARGCQRNISMTIPDYQTDEEILLSIRQALDADSTDEMMEKLSDKGYHDKLQKVGISNITIE